MAVGDNIKMRRFQLRMSQQELAEAMGYKTRSTIAKIESGENDVSQKKLQKFAAVLDTTVEFLIAGYSTVDTYKQSVQNIVDIKENKYIAVILAGGKSGRNQQNIPSQFISVHGKPILVHCLEVYQAHPSIDDIYVVCLKGWESIVAAYSKEYGITKLRGLVPAGNSGMSSLQNAVEIIKERYDPNDFVIIQEATRPLVSIETISKLLYACMEKGSATICHSMNEYVQFELREQRAQYIDRNNIIALQSPEAHRLFLLNEVFDKVKSQNYLLTESCCTMLLYNFGYDINFIEGGINNIKIVREEDIAAFGVLASKTF